MPKGKKIQPDDPEQSARFIETAKRVKAENDKELFERAAKKIVKVSHREKRYSKDPD